MTVSIWTDGEDGPDSGNFEMDTESENLTAAQEASNFMLLEVPISYTKPEFDETKMEPSINVMSNVAVSPKISNIVGPGRSFCQWDTCVCYDWIFVFRRLPAE